MKKKLLYLSPQCSLRDILTPKGLICFSAGVELQQFNGGDDPNDLVDFDWS